MSFFGGYFGSYFGAYFGAVGGGKPAPIITLVSPTAFSVDFATATVTPVVVDITDEFTPVTFITVIRGASVVYYGTPSGSFTADYVGSTVEPITGGYRLTILPVAGWASGEVVSLVVVASATDSDTTSLAISLAMPVEAADGLSIFLRDSVWRWRRRLRRRKCSVISVAIDDRYSEGPGFVLNALALEIGILPGLDRVPWRGGNVSNPGYAGPVSNGR